MKKTKLILFGLILFAFTANAQSQKKYEYTYDANGNRTMRVVKDTIKIKKLNPTASVPLIDTIGECKITIYPNPTKGDIKVDISNYTSEKKGFIIIVDIQGRVVYHNETLNSSNIIDISSSSAGNYIMNVVFGDMKKQWRIIKEQ